MSNSIGVQPPMRRGLTLIGMPASGKSTVATAVGQALNLPVIDVDGWLATHQNHGTVGHLIREHGPAHALALEESYITGLDLWGRILSPPGSVIYTGVQQHLARQSVVVFLDVPVEVLAVRLAHDTANLRGVIGLAEHGLERLYEIRRPLYEMWSECAIDTRGLAVADTVAEVVRLYHAHEPAGA